MKNTFWKRERIEIMIALALFNYVFLGAEYLFDNMMAFQTDSGGVVLAQSYVLGSSTVGFLLFGILDGKLRERAKKAGSAGAGVLAAVCLWGIQVHQSYGSILAAGLIIPALPYLLSFAAGAMLYVVVEELIPEMSEGSHSNIGTVLFAVGFSVMMILDVALG